MRTAVLIVGQKDWGKTSVLNKILKKSNSADVNSHIQCICQINQGFIVQNPSNGDYNVDQYLQIIRNKLSHYRKNLDFISALNPSQSRARNVEKVLDYFKSEETKRDHKIDRFVFFYIINKCDSTVLDNNRIKTILPKEDIDFIESHAPNNSEHFRIDTKISCDSHDNLANSTAVAEDIIKHLKRIY